MNDYETLLEKVKGLNRELALSYISAFGQMQEADGGDFRFHDGRCDALTDAKQLVEKIIEESPSRPGLAMVNDEFIAGLVAIREEMIKRQALYESSAPYGETWGEIGNCVSLVENLLEETRVARP